MNYKLLIDTSDQFLSVGIVLDEKIIYQNSYQAWQRQSELLIPEIIKALKSTKLELKDIKEIYLGKGPGSYTGVRIAMTVAKTLGTVTDIKIKAISSLAILGKADESFISVINARSKRSYVGVYEKGKCLMNDCILTNDEVVKLINEYRKKGFKLYGDSAYLNLESDGVNIIDGLLSFSKIAEYEENILALKPVYLKDAI